MSSPIKILVTGCNGRMGQAVIACSQRDEFIEVGAGVDIDDCLEPALAQCDAVIDFSFHSFTTQLVRACLARKTPVVIGTTGHSEKELEAIKEAASEIPLVMAPNFSIGVNMLFWLTRKTTEILGTGYDLEVMEMHHRMKQDSPSGTAKHLGEILANVTGLSYKDDTRHGRQGIVGPRTENEIGMHSLRGGDVIGDHTVVYSTSGERVELTHKASSRDTFANGAIRALKWLTNKTPGLYDMQDVLGLRD